MVQFSGSTIPRYDAVGEEDRQPQGRDPRVDQPAMAVDDGRRPSGETEPETSGLVELLLSGTCQPGLSSHRPPRAASAPPVASREAQGAESRDHTIPRREAA